MSNNTKSYPQSLPHGYRLNGKKHEYVIDRPLGQGAFGITYLARYKQQFKGEIGSGTVWSQVCIKEFFMKDMNSRDGKTGSLRDASDNSLISRYRRAFLREARNLSRMQHPNIVNVFEVIEANNTAYIVMEYKDGGSLDEYNVRKGHLSEDEALRLFQPLCDAICYMHAQNMLHLDLKPKNVMLDEEGTPFLIDFGLSKQYTADGEPESSTSIGLGTPGYAPGEQAEQRDGDKSFRATIDVYALGGTLYKMLTGETPPKATEITNALFKGNSLIQTNLLAAGVSRKTAAIVMKAMHPTSDMRYQNVAELMAALGWTAKAYDSTTAASSDDGETSADAEETVTIDEETQIVDEKPQPAPQPKPTPQSYPTPKSTPKWLIPVLAGVAALVIIVLSLRSCGKDESVASTSLHNGHEYVDLGLSVMWATCNVGASSPGAYGNHYAWGETTKKSDYSWETLKYRTSGDSWENIKFSKYVTNSDRDPVDNKKVLDLSDDAARQNWGGSWRMPTDAEWIELRDKCTWTWTTQGGHNGYKVVSKSNGNSIFLPAAGWRCWKGRFDAGEFGDYWSSSLNESFPYYSWRVGFTSSGVGRYYSYRCYGRSVRPVCRP